MVGQQHYSTKDAAKFLGVSPRTLERWRIEGRPPRFQKFGARVLYNKTELEHFCQKQMRESTSDPGSSS